MRVWTVLGAACVMALSGCDDVRQAADTGARETAKTTVIEILATRFPSVPKSVLEPTTDCIIDNSTNAEIIDFAKAAVVGVTEETVATARTVFSRPETLQCFRQAAVSAGRGAL